MYKHFRSKDELILAVLKQRHEQFNEMAQSKLNAAHDLEQPALVIFDVLDEWFQSEDFFGCFFIKAGSEYAEQTNPIHQYAAWHKESVRKMLSEFLRNLDEDDKQMQSEKLLILVEGAIVSAQVRGKTDAGKAAKQMAAKLL